MIIQDGDDYSLNVRSYSAYDGNVTIHSTLHARKGYELPGILTKVIAIIR